MLHQSIEIQCSPSWWLRIKLRGLAFRKLIPLSAIDDIVSQFGNQVLTLEDMEIRLKKIGADHAGIDVNDIKYTLVSFDDHKHLNNAIRYRVAQVR